ncbi:two pore channel protein 2-like [Styela clava]
MKLNTMSTSAKIVNGRTSSSMPLLSAEESNVDNQNLEGSSSVSGSSLNSDNNSAGEDASRSSQRTETENNEKDLSILQGVVLLEDAIYYRSIHHRMDAFSIRLYRWYHSSPVKWSIYAVIFFLLFLAFLEEPSSLVWSTDPRQQLTRYTFPAGLLEGVEFACLLMLLTSTIIQSYLAADMQNKRDFPKKQPWLTGSFIVVFLALTDIIISLALGNNVYRWRFRRLLRPYFLAGSSTMLKKTLKCIRNTLPEIASVLTLLLLHVYFFMMLGMLCFPRGGHRSVGNETHSELNNTEWREYFRSIDTAFMSLLVLLTTANNPDVMMPSYSDNRLYAIYFIVFSLIGTYLIFNLLTAVVYNQFRGYFQNSMQSSHSRRCVAFSAAYVVLSDSELHGTTDSAEDDEPSTLMDHDNMSTVSMTKLKKVLSQVSMRPEQRTAVHHNILNLGSDLERINKVDFHQVFSNIDSLVTSEVLRVASMEMSDRTCRKRVQVLVLHPAFNIIGNIMVLLNAILVTVEIAIHYEIAFREVFSRLNVVNYIFAAFYLVEQTLKVIALGKRYFLTLSDVYDGMITVALIIVETIQLARYGGKPDAIIVTGISLWDLARIINILVILRLLRIIPNFKPMAVVTTTLLEIMRNLSSFAGVLAIIYYIFAIIGMIFFEGKTDPLTPPAVNNSNSTFPHLAQPDHFKCGTFEQLQYWANNFNDFASSLVVLWDVMVVNNWGVFLDMYTRRVGEWSQLYFIIWWIVSVVISVNLFIALILDHFIAKWDRVHEAHHLQRLGRRGTVQALFLSSMHDPSPSEINKELLKHPYLRWHVSSPS